VLPQIAALIGIDLGAGIIEIVIFDKGAELRCPIVICACDHLPREIRVISTSARAKGAVRGGDVDTSGFRIVNAEAAADIWLESSKSESPDEVPHKRPSVNEGSHATAPQHNTFGIPQGEISATSEAVIKKVPFNGRTKYACAKNVTEFDAAEEPDIVFRIDFESEPEIILKSSGSAAA